MTDATPVPSPNFNSRKAPPDMALIHYTGLSTADSLRRLCDPPAEVSAHWLIDEAGQVYALVPEERRAWHAGVSFWKGERDVNAVSIGIELTNPGHGHGYRPFPRAQVDSLTALLDEIRGRWTIPDSRVLGHSDVSPGRKIDPGELFPWALLAERGHGLWTEPEPSPGEPLAEGEEGVGVFALQAGLTRLGYDCAPSGTYDADTARIVTAFQRHWRPARFDGVADGETRARLVSLLRLAADA